MAAIPYPDDVQLDRRLAQQRILIVDDDEMMREFLRLNLAEGGYTAFEMAADGREALRRIDAAAPGIVILDMTMPVMDGFEVLRRLRADERTENLPVLVTTGIETREGRNEILRAGASTLISKPVDGSLLLERTTSLLERSLLMAELTRYRLRLEYELSTARNMQRRIMPSDDEIRAVGARYDCRIAAHYEFSSELGGDLWGLRPLDEKRLMLFMADFSGHGVAAALNAFRLHTIVSESHIRMETPAGFLAEMNTRLYDLLERGQFATMLSVILDLERRTLTYAGAAAPEPILGRAGDGRLRRMDASGLLLGATRHATYENRELPIEPGTFLFMYSDALMETPDAAGRMLGSEGVETLVARALATAPESPVGAILDQFERHRHAPLVDDLTMVWLAF